MAQARRKRESVPLFVPQLYRGLREGAFFLLMALALYLLIALVTFSSFDPGWSHTGMTGKVRNAGGIAGAWLADVALYLFGYLAYLLPAIVAYVGWMVFRGRSAVVANGPMNLHFHGVRWAGFVMILLSACGLASMHFATALDSLPVGADAGGIIGNLLSLQLISVFNDLGTTLFLLAFFLAAMTLFTGVSWLLVMDVTGKLSLGLVEIIANLFNRLRERFESSRRRPRTEVVVPSRPLVLQEKVLGEKKPLRIEPVIRNIELGERVQKEKQIHLFDSPADPDLPPLSLLDVPDARRGGYSSQALEAMSRLLELKLGDFNVEVEVVAVHPGPVITRFELQPAPGVKVSQISNLAKDLARSLSTISVRVVEVIPGKSTVGLEVPNEQREIVRLSELLKSKDYEKSASPLTIALGKDISGNPVIADLGRMPHLLVAGTTGSGKSVALNAMLLSLLYKAAPVDLRLILIDPKMLELNVYEGIPHLLAPVVTDMKEAANALRWCVAEMENRYRLMSALGVRNIAGYNRKVTQAIDEGTPIPDPLYNREQAFDPEAEPPTLEGLPYIVVVIDELADLMIVVGKKVEELIARIAQKARAAGIHLILATQRPSVDIITGLIKANIPTRMAFQVSSKVDSRTILDQMGAEALLGHGDMLYLPPGTAHPLRLHGAFVDDPEVHRVVQNLKGSGDPDYLREILEEGTALAGLAGGNGADDAETDPLYDEAVAIVTETRKASISYVQRRLKIGYNRAARMIEDMETAGIVSPLQSNGSREVLAGPPPEA